MPLPPYAFLLSTSYIIRKALTFLTLPLGICLCLLVASVLTGRRKLTAAALALLVAASAPAVADQLLRTLERRHPRLTVDACPPAEAIVVLGGLVSEWTGGQRVEWSDAVDRFEAGVRLAQANKAPMLVFGGGALRPEASGRNEGQAMRHAAIDRGVAPDTIRLLANVEVTADEAHAVAALARSEGFGRIILVTSAFHMPRSVTLFERAGLDVTPFPVDYLAPDRGGIVLLDFAPHSEALRRTEIALKEYYGMAYYRLLGTGR